MILLTPYFSSPAYGLLARLRILRFEKFAIERTDAASAVG